MTKSARNSQNDDGHTRRAALHVYIFREPNAGPSFMSTERVLTDDVIFLSDLPVV
jgi:hypothetical protein